MKRFDIYLVNLDPTIGSEIKKIRPALLISPDEMNDNLDTVIIAPMTTTIRKWKTRIAISFEGKKGQVALDQIRAVDKKRLVKKLGKISSQAARLSLDTLQEMFKL
ncbi:MAG: type II toxin-antitoxin system PemK/MazF family toxin [Pseudomonadota bacterium]